MLKISKVATLAAVLSLTALPAVGVADVMAQDAPTTTSTSGLSTTLSVPTITAVDSTMDEAALRDALSGGFMKHVDEFAKLSATSITIPTITLTLTTSPNGGKPMTSTVDYKDVVLSDVKDGVAASASIGSVATTSPEGSFSFGKMSTSTLDIGAILALYSLVPPGDTSQPMKALYKDLSFEGGSFTSPEASCTFGKVTAHEFDARPLKVSFSAMVKAANRMDAAKGKPAAEDIATFVSFITDVFQAFKSTPLGLDGIDCSGTNDGKSFSLSIGGIGMDGYAPGIYPALELKDLKFSAGAEGSFSLADAKFKAIDLHGPIAAVEAAGTDLDEKWFNDNARQLIPAWGGLSFSGLSFDVPNPEHPSDRYQASVADFDLTLSDYLNGIPTKLSTTASGVDVPLPADSSDDSVKMLQAIGITRVNLNYELSAAWDKASQSINIDKVSVSGNDLGSFAIAAVLGNATEQLFAIDPDAELAASQAITLKTVNINAADAGLADKVWPLLAAEEGADPKTYRAQLASSAEGAAIAMLGSTDAARQLGAAISDFISGAKKSLTINVAAKDPAGIGMTQLMMASDDPTVLMSAVDITGSAE